MKQFFFSYWKWIKTLPGILLLILVASPIVIHLGKLVWLYWKWNFNLW